MGARQLDAGSGEPEAGSSRNCLELSSPLASHATNLVFASVSWATRSSETAMATGVVAGPPEVDNPREPVS